MSDSNSRVRLADAIQQLRSELQEAVESGSREGLRFEVLDLELELQVVVSEESSDPIGAKGGLKLAAGGGSQHRDPGRRLDQPGPEGSTQATPQTG